MAGHDPKTRRVDPFISDGRPATPYEVARNILMGLCRPEPLEIVPDTPEKEKIIAQASVIIAATMAALDVPVLVQQGRVSFVRPGFDYMKALNVLRELQEDLEQPTRPALIGAAYDHDGYTGNTPNYLAPLTNFGKVFEHESEITPEARRDFMSMYVQAQHGELKDAQHQQKFVQELERTLQTLLTKKTQSGFTINYPDYMSSVTFAYDGAALTSPNKERAVRLQKALDGMIAAIHFGHPNVAGIVDNEKSEHFVSAPTNMIQHAQSLFDAVPTPGKTVSATPQEEASSFVFNEKSTAFDVACDTLQRIMRGQDTAAHNLGATAHGREVAKDVHLLTAIAWNAAELEEAAQGDAKEMPDMARSLALLKQLRASLTQAPLPAMLATPYDAMGEQINGNSPPQAKIFSTPEALTPDACRDFIRERMQAADMRVHEAALDIRANELHDHGETKIDKTLEEMKTDTPIHFSKHGAALAFLSPPLVPSQALLQAKIVKHALDDIARVKDISAHSVTGIVKAPGGQGYYVATHPKVIEEAQQLFSVDLNQQQAHAL